jgi:hypothetical protein
MREASIFNARKLEAPLTFSTASEVSVSIHTANIYENIGADVYWRITAELAAILTGHFYLSLGLFSTSRGMSG